MRGQARNAVARVTVSSSAGGLAIGELNAAFYRRYGARKITFAPYSVDDERFAHPPSVSRHDLLARWGLRRQRAGHHVLRQADPAQTAARPDRRYWPTAGQGDHSVRRGRPSFRPGPGLAVRPGAITGFVNQSELPSFYHAADILVLPSEAEPWGLVVNEAMAAGALPLVSDRVGAGPDLVRGIGEIYPCGDVTALAGALARALEKLADPGIRDRVRRHVGRHSMDTTAAGFEEAVLALPAVPR